jgi:hypothetical protein
MRSVLAFLSFLLLTSAGALLSAAEETDPQILQKHFDFRVKKAGFQDFGIDFFFADLPSNQIVNGRDLEKLPGKTLPDRLKAESSTISFDEGEPTFYQLTQLYDEYDSTVSGQLIAYHNRSDDLDVNLQIPIDGSLLKPDMTYQISAKIAFVSNAPAGRPGIGGSVDSNSFGLALSQSPWKIRRDDDSNGMLRTYTDDGKGRVIRLGVPSGRCTSRPLKDMDEDDRWICEHYRYMGRISNGLDESKASNPPDLDTSAWRSNSIETKPPLEFETDESGRPLYVNLNSHSGFEGLTVYYIQSIDLTVQEKQP